MGSQAGREKEAWPASGHSHESVWAERAACLRSHSQPGPRAPTSWAALPLSAFRVFLSGLREVGKEREGRACCPWSKVTSLGF